MMARAFVIAAAITSLAGQQSRDVATPLPPGTGTIAGTVVVDDDASKPMRGAIVTLNHVDRQYADTSITDERGRFAFRRVPAGRYLVSASKESYVTLRYGAARPGRAGIPIALANGEQREDLRVTLIRGAVLTGTVRLANGEAAQGAEVRVQRVITGAAGKRYVDSFEHSGSSADDQGMFRIYGLVEGDYILHVIPQLHFMPGGSALLPTRSVDVQWARAQIRAASATARTAAPPNRETLSLVPIYYPGALHRSQASVISLARGEVRAGLDMTLQLIPSYRVTGTVSSPAGVLKGTPQIFLLESRPDGIDITSGVHGAEGATFAMAGVTPGVYTLIATVPEEKLYAMSEVRVANQDVPVSLTLQPTLTMAGRVVFSGSAKPPDLKHIRLHLAPAGSGVMLDPSTASIRPDGTFTVEGVVPGLYRLVASIEGATGWSVRSAALGAEDLAQTRTEITTASAAEPLVVTFTDRATALTGRLQDELGRAASDYFIIVFSRNERAWFERSRAIAQTRPASDGQFTFRGLPPGDYYLAAVTDVERDEWFDAGFLRELVPLAIPLSLAEGQRVEQDIRIRK